MPRLFSDSLRENVVMGRATHGERLGSALELAVLRHDVDRLERGLDMLVGARGVKLSGGQVQCSAAARMFMRDADLQVIDDLSSALDVETEAHLWDGLFAPGGVTCLAVSHRRAALQRADRVIVMARGRVVAMGPLEQLLETSAELRELWRQDVADASPAVLAWACSSRGAARSRGPAASAPCRARRPSDRLSGTTQPSRAGRPL